MRDYLYAQNYNKLKDAINIGRSAVHLFVMEITDDLISEFEGQLMFVFDDFRTQQVYYAKQIIAGATDPEAIDAVAQLVADMTTMWAEHMHAHGYTREDLVSAVVTGVTTG